MPRWMIIVLAVLALPYGYLALYWGQCLLGACRFDGHMLFYSFVALVAIPFIMAFIGGGLALRGARRLRGAAAPSGPAARSTLAQGVRGGIGLWIGTALLTSAVPACAALLMLMLDTPEEGRDRLGRICETKGSVTTCRPDPDADHPTPLEQANRARQRKPWFAAD